MGKELALTQPSIKYGEKRKIKRPKNLALFLKTIEEEKKEKKPKNVTLLLKDKKGFQKEFIVPFPPPATFHVPIPTRLVSLSTPLVFERNEVVFHYVKCVSDYYYEYEEQE